MGTGDESAEDEPLTISSKLMVLGKLLELSDMLESLLSLPRNNDESSEEPRKISITLLLFDEFPLPNVLKLPEKPLFIPTELLNSLVSFSESGSSCKPRGESIGIFIAATHNQKWKNYVIIYFLV